jgi:LacI family transcriptional regulator
MVRIADIAQHLNVSPATVSRALNGKPGVSEQMRALIVAEAARLSFAPNGAARSLATTRTENIGFAIYQPPLATDQFFGPFYSRIMFGAEQELQTHEYHLLVTTLTDKHIAHPEQWSVARSRRVDGLIIAGPLIPARFSAVLSASGLPIVLVDNAIASMPVDAVLGEDRAGACRVAEHLLSHGHKRVVIIAGPEEWPTNRERCEGFADALRAARVAPLAVFRADATTHDTGVALMQEALRHEPTAVLAINDAMALGAIDAAQAAGRSVPGEIAITGFDDIEPARHSGVPVTTAHVPKRTLGRIAARQLLSRIEQPEAPHQRVLVETPLVIRCSCGCAPSTPQSNQGPHAGHPGG